SSSQWGARRRLLS
ncbi:acyl-CoA dehydrogenase, N-terminal domain protein, partial [Vibrio parahaemolyticus V-223/04]